MKKLTKIFVLTLAVLGMGIILNACGTNTPTPTISFVTEGDGSVSMSSVSLTKDVTIIAYPDSNRRLAGWKLLGQNNYFSTEESLTIKKGSVIEDATYVAVFVDYIEITVKTYKIDLDDNLGFRGAVLEKTEVEQKKIGESSRASVSVDDKLGFGFWKDGKYESEVLSKDGILSHETTYSYTYSDKNLTFLAVYNKIGQGCKFVHPYGTTPSQADLDANTEIAYRNSIILLDKYNSTRRCWESTVNEYDQSGNLRVVDETNTFRSLENADRIVGRGEKKLYACVFDILVINNDFDVYYYGSKIVTYNGTLSFIDITLSSMNDTIIID